jgi:glycosyltransferase involved in cell wall biosynthesis
MDKNIFYWSPYLGRVATIKSVLNSMIGLSKFSKKKFKISIINCFGEWDQNILPLKKNNIETITLQKRIKFNIDTYGFIISRLMYLATFFLTYKQLKDLLVKKRPDYLIVHLLTFIPLFLFYNNTFNTKLILRISGKPVLSFYRRILWKLMNKKLHLIFCPTLETKKYLTEKKIFESRKIKFLPDPVLYDIDTKQLSSKKNIKNLKKNSYYLCIGRLTKQKNQELLIKMFNLKKFKQKLLIIGDGELSNYLKNLISNLDLEKKIIMMKYQKNIFYYIKRSKAVIIPSLWEDPGFVMIEAAYLKKTIICSNCPSGPREFIGKNKGGFLFNSNSITSLNNALNKFDKSNNKTIYKKIKYAKNKSKIYTIENHTKQISNYL